MYVTVLVNKLEPYTEPWQDLVFGPMVCDIANVEGDPVRASLSPRDSYLHCANLWQFFSTSRSCCIVHTTRLLKTLHFASNSPIGQ